MKNKIDKPVEKSYNEFIDNEYVLNEQGVIIRYNRQL